MVLVPGSSTAVAIPAAVALSTYSRSVASFSCLAKRSHSRRSPGPCSAPTPPAVPDPSTGSSRVRSRTRYLSGGCTHPRDPSASRSRSRHPSGGRSHQRDLFTIRSRLRAPSSTCSSSQDRSSHCSASRAPSPACTSSAARLVVCSCTRRLGHSPLAAALFGCCTYLYGFALAVANLAASLTGTSYHR